MGTLPLAHKGDGDIERLAKAYFLTSGLVRNRGAGHFKLSAIPAKRRT